SLGPSYGPPPSNNSAGMQAHYPQFPYYNNNNNYYYHVGSSQPYPSQLSPSIGSPPSGYAPVHMIAMPGSSGMTPPQTLPYLQPHQMPAPSSIPSTYMGYPQLDAGSRQNY